VKILVFGAGAVGCAFGGFLSSTHEVTLYGRKKWLNPIRKQGLRVSGIWGRHHFKRLQIETDLKKLVRKRSEFDLILVTVKSFDTEKAARSIRRLMGPKTWVLSLQNGLGNIETLHRYLPKKQILAGRVIFGIVLQCNRKGLKPKTEIKITVSAEPTAIGETTARRITSRVRKIVRIFQKAHLPTVTTTNVRGLLWLKVIYNCALNPLASLLRCHYGQLGENPETRWIMGTVIREIYQVAQKARVRLNPKTAEGYRELFYTKLLPRTYHHHPSMLQDLLRKKAGKPRRTEIEALNGAIVKLGGKYKAGTTMNRILRDLIHKQEKK